MFSLAEAECVHAAPQTDKELLQRFLEGDEQAFAAVVERHAIMVRAVCQRVLRNTNDSDDAFQATFFVLASRAKSIAWQDSVGGWLHEVARRVSLRLKSDLSRRRDAEVASAKQRLETPAMSPTGLSMHELGELLDHELGQLPARFREVIVLTQAEGLSRSEAASRLGISVAAVKDRLERGREMLQKRLLKRGLTLSSVTLAAWLIPSSANAAGIQTLVATTAPMATSFAAGNVVGAQLSASAALAQGVINVMGLQKVSVVLAFLATLITGGSLAYGFLQDNPNRFDEGLRGTLVRIDTDDTPSLTIELDEYRAKLDLDVSTDAKVWIAYQETEFDKLRVGQFIAVQLASDNRTVKEVHGRGELREVTVEAIGNDGRLIVAGDDDDENLTPVTLEMSPETIVRIGGLPAKRDELRPGMSIPIEFNQAGNVVNAIETDASEGQLIEGEIATIDIEKREITLRHDDDHDEQVAMPKQVLSLVPSSLIHVDGKPAQDADLKSGFVVRVRLADDRTTIRAIEAISSAHDAEVGESDDQ